MDALTDDLPLIEECKALLKQLVTAKQENRDQQELDMKYVAGEQWTEDERIDRENNGRPCFTVNRIGPTLSVVVNQMLQDMPAIEVSPNGDGAEVETAEIISNMIRGIEQDSNAASAYGNAGFYQVAIGEGYFRIASRYIDENSFEQELVIKPIDNPFTVLFDENSVEPDGKDADVCLIVKDMSPYEYKNKYPSTKLSEALTTSGWMTQVPGLTDWVTGTTVRVVEYWKRVYVPKKIYLVQTLDFVTMNVIKTESTETKPTDEELDVEYAAHQAKNMMDALQPGEAPYPVVFKKIIQTRESMDLKVMQYVLNGIEKLSETEFPGRYIPIIPVRGDFIYANGKRHISGMVRPMRDPQKLYNLQANLQVETIALAPKAPFVGYPEQIEGFEDMWEQANSQNFAFLPIKKVPGLENVMPQRMNSEPAIQAVAATRASFAEDMKAVTGVFDASLGNRQGEESGKAILARQHQSETGNWKYSNNLKRAIKQAGRILVDIIPHFYDTERMVKIVKPTGEAELIAVNKYHDSPVLGDMNNEKKHDLTVGKYDVVVMTGKSYATQRQEAVDSMMELGRAAPDKFPLIADLIVKNMDWSGAAPIAKRLRADLEMNMPGLLEATGEAGQEGVDSEVKAIQSAKKAQDMQQGLEQAIQIGEKLKQEIAFLKQDNQNLRSKSEVDLYVAEMNYKLKQQEMALEEQKAIQQGLQMQLDYQLALRKLGQDDRKAEISAVNAAANIADSMHDREVTILDKTMEHRMADLPKEPKLDEPPESEMT